MLSNQKNIFFSVKIKWFVVKKNPNLTAFAWIQRYNCKHFQMSLHLLKVVSQKHFLIISLFHLKLFFPLLYGKFYRFQHIDVISAVNN